MAPSLVFQSLRIFRESHDLDARLYEILIALVERAWPDSSHPARITCIFRTQAEEAAVGGKTGIHTQGPPYRAVDVGAKEFTQAQIDASAAAVNKLWEYDPNRPEKAVCFAQPHGDGLHFHLQVHPNTRKR